jgi:hypothetical protein
VIGLPLTAPTRVHQAALLRHDLVLLMRYYLAWMVLGG